MDKDPIGSDEVAELRCKFNTICADDDSEYDNHHPVLYKGEAAGPEAVYGIGEGGGAAGGRIQGAGSRQHGMSVCNGEAVGREAFCSVGKGGGVAGGRV